MDIATLIGIAAALGLIVIAIFENIGAFIDVNSILIVFGGTVASIFVRFPMGVVFSLFGVMSKTLFTRLENPDEMIRTIINLSVEAKKNGILGLEKIQIENAFLKKGVQLAIDGVEPELIESVLNIDMATTGQRHETGTTLLSTAGDAAPAFGMIGTLVGLVLMLGNMDDPKAIGPAMAVALVTTFYGSVASNVVLLPLADKLKYYHQQEMLLKQLIVAGILSIANGDHPAVVQEKLASFLKPSLRQALDSGNAGH